MDYPSFIIKMYKNATKSNTYKKALLKALEKSMGNVSEACKMAGLNRTTYYRYYKEDPNFKATVDDIAEENLDFAEGQLLKLIKGVEIETTIFFMYKGEVIAQPVIKKHIPDKTAIIFYLKTKGKKRGYVESQENIKDTKADLFERMTEEEIDTYLAELEAEEARLQVLTTTMDEN